MRRILAIWVIVVALLVGLLVHTKRHPGSRPTFFGHTLMAGKPGHSTQRGSLAIVHIYGPIKTSQSASGWGSPDADEIVKQLHRLSENDDVKAILLRINSPGGTVGAVQEINTEIMRCKSKGKKVVASMGDVAASGGYYLAAGADRIVSNPGTITGSIGVIMEFGNLQGLLQKFGVSLEVVKSGKFKDIGSPARPLTAEERHLLQDSIDDAYAQFVDAVAKGRKMPLDKVLPLADGRIYTGRQAMQVGLVDEMGNSQDAITVALNLANLPADAPVISDVSKKSLLSLFSRMGDDSSLGPLEPLKEHSSGVALEYLLQ